MIILFINESNIKSFKEKFKTMTVNNGSEFLDFKGIERSVRNMEQLVKKVHYAQPHSLLERCTNEDFN